MTSVVIGLDIGGTHITGTLIRVDDASSNRTVTIDGDVFHTRSIESSPEKDPRSIVCTWVECIEDVLHDFVSNYEETDSIIGIACGIPGPMDYERGISYIQSTQLDKCEKFFGLNLRLALADGLRDLIARWKRVYNPKYFTPPSTPRSSVFDQEKQASLEKSIHVQRAAAMASTATRHAPFPYTDAQLHDQDTPTADGVANEIASYCGLQDDQEAKPRSEGSQLAHEITVLRKSFGSIPLTSKVWTMIKQLPETPIAFYNDATCFALGEANSDENKDRKRILALTLGTGFGSTFIDQGEIILERDDVPPGGMLWNFPYDEQSIADDWFSTRGLIKLYHEVLREGSIDASEQTDVTDGRTLAARASSGDEHALNAFRRFARLLGEFLLPHVDKFQADALLIGGGIAHAYSLIDEELTATLRKSSHVTVGFNLSHEKSICLGAVYQQLPTLLSSQPSIFRKSQQNLLPAIKTVGFDHYDLYPCHRIPTGHICIGHEELSEKLVPLITEHRLLLIDGFVGTHFDEFANELNKFYHHHAKSKNLSSLVFYDARTFLRTDLDAVCSSYLQSSQSIFGKVAADLQFKRDFIDADKLNYLQKNLSYPCVIIGPGASFVDETAPLVYIDLAKNELYYRVAAESASSYLKPRKQRLPVSEPTDLTDSDDYQLTPAMYEQKCLYFLDYPVFNTLKQELLPRMTYFVDGQRPHCPTWLDGDTFRQALAHLAHQPVRVRPWFEPGPWGGQWLKSVCTNLSQSPKNYAWSFEMITPENGIILADANHHLAEFSWDLFYGSQVGHILGNDLHVRLFRGPNDFPIRFDFLDTIDGGNLSIQCHPNLQYIRTNFGERITQDETYYILETKQHWKTEHQNDPGAAACVYLGFQDNVDPDEFHRALQTSRRETRELDVQKYIQCLPSTVHDFFLIPNETIHASGYNQVVLEISATPYTYTFKLYDWLRLGLDGRLRPLNIAHGMKNLQFDRRGEQLRCRPISLRSVEGQYEEQHLPTHDLHFYDVHRLIIQPNESIDIVRSTENRFHLCMLVEGDAIELEYQSPGDSKEKQVQRYNYIETFLIPASIGEYRLRPIRRTAANIGQPRQWVLIIAFLKWDCEQLLQ